jgi:hypothetical protein
MSVEIAKDRPAYVQFEVRAEEDRAATVEAGHYVARDVDFVIITPAGSKDRIERRADEWLVQIKQQVQEQRLPPEWAQAYRAAYGEWKEGREIPLNGTAIVNWPAVSPAQVKALLEARMRTVEDLAVANEETITRLGMGGRALKQRAVDWLASAKDVGKVGEEISAMRVLNESLTARNEELTEQLAGLSKRLASLESSSAAKVTKL